MKNYLFIKIFLLFFVYSNIQAQSFTNKYTSYRPPGKEKIVIYLKPNHPDWLYALGEEAIINIELTNTTVKEASISYAVGLELMATSESGTVQTVNGKVSLNIGTLNAPGFLRCTFTATIDGIKHTEMVSVGFAPHLIEPTVEMPTDFLEFWQNAIADARNIPPNYNLTLLTDKSTSTTNVYQLDFENHKAGSKFYAVVSIPKNPGKYPALIRLPGAGVQPAFGAPSTSASKNIIVIDVYIHEYPVTMEAEFYTNLGATVLNGYQFFGIENRDTYYFKRVIVGCVKTIDCLFQFPEFDGKNLIAYGSSQGGALSTITTALDKRIKYYTAFFSAMSDQTGYLYGRAGGWPHYFKGKALTNVSQDALNSARYYDVANFARYISVPGFYSWGYIDNATPTTSVYASYNVITAPKETLIILNGAHRVYPEMSSANSVWQDQVLAKLKSEGTGLQDIYHPIDKLSIKNNTLSLQLKLPKSQIDIYNVQGVKIFSQSIAKKDISIVLNEGVYILKVNENSLKILI